MIVTLLDMVAMFSLPPDSEEVTSLLWVEDDVSLDFGSTEYGPFLSKNYRTKGPVPETEYTAFLLYWLCDSYLSSDDQHS